MRSLERSYDGFIEEGIEPLGINVDHHYSKSAWGKVINISKLSMLSDYNPLGEVSRAYGVFREDLNASGRVNILVDEEGLVQWVEVYEISEIPDFEKVLEKLRSL